MWGELLHSKPMAAASPQVEAAWQVEGGWQEAEALLKNQLRAFQGHVDGALLPEQVHQGLMDFYSGLQPSQRIPFLLLVAQQLGVQEEDVSSAIGNWQQALARKAGVSAAASAPEVPAPAAAGAGTEALLRAAERLRVASQPLYSQLFQPISREPGGIPFLVTLRSHLRAALGAQPSLGAPLRALDEQLKQALSSWFTPGLLKCQLLTWETTPAVLLEKLQQYEAVHAIRGFEDMKRRMGPDRRVHAYFHPCLPGEPLVILHAALMDHVPGNMDEVLDSDVGPSGCDGGFTADLPAATVAQAAAPLQPPAAGLPSVPAPLPCSQPTVAAFYSISSTQPGLAGVDLGHLLIMQVAKKVQAELPCVRQLVTLSPLPGFRAWLKSKLAALALEDRGRAAAMPPPPTTRPPTPPTHPGGTGDGDGTSAPLATEQDQGHVGATLELPPLQWVGVGPNSLPAPPLLTAGEAAAVAAAAERGLLALPALEALREEEARAGGVSAAARALEVLEGGLWLAPASAWVRAGGVTAADPSVEAAKTIIHRVLLRAAARYLVLERRRNMALDSVAHFHLRNGAQLLRINFAADWRPGGMERSFGIMVNYNYDLAQAHANNRGYLMEHVIQASPGAIQLLTCGID